MAVTIDIGEADDIHPRNKQDVGRRLALWALHRDYGRNVVHSGPIMRNARFRGGRAVVSFDHAHGGLVTSDGAPPKGFAIAGLDREFHWADAEMRGSRVVLTSEAVPEPVAVRYGWANNPEVNLYNRAGLPASPFRSDHWPGATVAQR